MSRMEGTLIPDAQLGALMNVLYNVWFCKWKRMAVGMTDEQFDLAASELDHIMEQGAQYPLVKHLAITFLYELDARMHDGYTEAARNKLLSVIGKREEKT